MGVGASVYMYEVVVKKFTFAISSPDEFLVLVGRPVSLGRCNACQPAVRLDLFCMRVQ